jgi:tape measure domain-containing protein
VEQLAMALSSVSDGTESLAKQFAALKEAAKLPGLGFSEIAKGSLDLQSVGVSAEASRDIIIQLGNALSSTGKGKAELEGITTALSQMYGKGKVSAEEINQIAERYPAIRSIAADLDKSTPAKFTEGLTAALAKLPRAAGTAQDSFDNLNDAVDQFMTGKSGGRLNQVGKSLADGIAGAINASSLDEAAMKLGRGVRGTAADLPDNAFAKYELTPEEAVKRQKDKLEGIKAEADAKQKLLDTEIDIADTEGRLAAAKKDNDDAGVLTLSKELEILKEKKKLMDTIGISEQEAIDHINRKVTAEVAGANRVRDAERAKKQGKEGRDLSELEAQAGGMSSRRFKKLHKANRLADEEERLIAEGLTPEQAKEKAARTVGAETTIAENEERASRGLRPKIRSVTDSSERSRNRYNRLSSGDKRRLEGAHHAESGAETFSRHERGGIDAGADDPMALRSNPSNLRKPITGAGHKEKKSGSNDNPSANLYQVMAKGFADVVKAVMDTGPNAAQRAKPTNI